MCGELLHFKRYLCAKKSKYEIIFLDINKTFLYISAYLRNIFVYLQHKIQT